MDKVLGYRIAMSMILDLSNRGLTEINISDEHIDTLYALNLSGNNITSLKGLQKFESLR